jgi:hypothetical protein
LLCKLWPGELLALSKDLRQIGFVLLLNVSEKGVAELALLF